MRQFLNISNIYILLWVLYSLQGTLYATGSIISQGILAILLLWSIYYCFVVNTKYHSRELPSFIKAVNVFLIMATIYGIILILSGKELYITEVEIIKTSNLDYLKNVYISLLPLYSFYEFSKRKLLTEEHIRVLIFILFVVAIISFIEDQERHLMAALELGSNREEFTLNSGYKFLHLIPLCLFWYKKPIVQVALLLTCAIFLVICMKRGAILIGAICIIYYIFTALQFMKGKQKFAIMILIIVATFVVIGLIQNMIETSEYFSYRIEQTLEGDSSNRDVIYSKYWNHIKNEQSPLRFLFGNGANATLSIGPNYAHNDWLEIAINNGLIGVIIYIAYFISLIRDCIQSRKRLKYYYSNSLLMSTLILLSASFFSMSYGSIGISQTLAIGFVLAAINRDTYNNIRLHNKKVVKHEN